jgi:acetoin:2,6-dichlorophenolindophenol oxidoreductase subunit alpha
MQGLWEERMARMLRARRLDEALIEHGELITGVFHVGIGQEGTAAALAAVRGPSDVVTLTHRNHHHLAAMGSDMEVMFREILGRDGGPQRGRAGTLHLADAGVGVPYTSAMVAGGVPLAVGLAFGKVRLGEEGIVFCFLGDGALGEGAVQECFNIASLWRAPVLFVCENNATPENGRANAFQAAPNLASLAEVNGIVGRAADARDPAEVESALGLLAQRVRDGKGPAFLDARSEPWPGNRTFMIQAGSGRLDLTDAARPAESDWERGDPILNEARRLLRVGVGVEALLALDAAIREEVERAFEAAARAPLPPASVALSDVWDESWADGFAPSPLLERGGGGG